MERPEHAFVHPVLFILFHLASPPRSLGSCDSDTVRAKKIKIIKCRLMLFYKKKSGYTFMAKSLVTSTIKGDRAIAPRSLVGLYRGKSCAGISVLLLPYVITSSCF